MIINFVTAATMGPFFGFTVSVMGTVPAPALFVTVGFMFGIAAEALRRWWVTP